MLTQPSLAYDSVEYSMLLRLIVQYSEVDFANLLHLTRRMWAKWRQVRQGLLVMPVDTVVAQPPRKFSTIG